ncbi:MAG TPA: hypothetical protein VLX44_00610 [Xanthobacteraceae bacterium]|nr:hypothetical protein [Xanthobacteraceae bacterium]
MSIAAFTALHVVISLVGIVSGVVVLAAMLKGKAPAGWTALFLATTVLTSATGFLFPATGFTPAQGVGILSLILLAVALFAFYGQRLAGAWRWLYVVTAVSALYFNCFVAVVQSFQKLPFLHVLAPTQLEPPFQVAQLIVLAIFIIAGILAIRRFHPERRPRIALEASIP